MTPEEIEEEVQARVKFKLDDVLSHAEARIKKYYNASFMTSMHGNVQESIKCTARQEAFEEFKEIVYKELYMSVPIDNMALTAKRKLRDEAVDKLRSFHKIGSHYERRPTAIVSIVEKLLNM
jgi:hypothetical protein